MPMATTHHEIPHFLLVQLAQSLGIEKLEIMSAKKINLGLENEIRRLIGLGFNIMLTAEASGVFSAPLA